jgi:predicted component of viral defense system (DUF524 family)
MKKELIKLGFSNPDLKPYISKVLDRIASTSKPLFKPALGPFEKASDTLTQTGIGLAEMHDHYPAMVKKGKSKDQIKKDFEKVHQQMVKDLSKVEVELGNLKKVASQLKSKIQNGKG